MKIFGIPTNEKYDYEFMVVIPRDDGNFDFYSNHENADAFEIAEEVGGVVVHDVRIAHKRLREGV